MDKDKILTEFSIPAGEIDAPLQTGDLGKISLHVEVIGTTDGLIHFRKHKKAITDGNFKPEGANDMRERLLEKQDAEEDATDPKDNPEE